MRNGRGWVAALTALLLLICYASTLRGMVEQWWSDEDMSHGFAVLPVIAWILWRERARWRTLPVQPSAWGFVLLAAAAGMHATASLGLGLFLSAVALLLSAMGAVLCLGGFAFLRAWSFPFALSLFMLPKLAIVYNKTTLPLQLLASRLAAGVLSLAGWKPIREGVILDVGGHRVSVVEACSGVRYLLSLAFIAVVFAYLADARTAARTDARPFTRKLAPWVLLLAAVPIAIVANAIRVAASAAIPALDSGTPHEAAGAAVFVLCLMLIFAVRKLFDSLWNWSHDRV